MMFSKEPSLPLGTKSLLMYQIDFLKEESPLPIKGKRAERRTIDGTSQPDREVQSKVETRGVSLHVLLTERFGSFLTSVIGLYWHIWIHFRSRVSVHFRSSSTTPNGPNFARNELRNFPTKFGVKFTTSFPSSRFDWQLRNEIAKFVANFGNFKRTSETVCQKFCETH